MTSSWYEVWADDGLDPPYVLILIPRHEGKVDVFDPKEGRVALEAANHDEAKLWLLEEEYTRVEGRMDVSDDSYSPAK